MARIGKAKPHNLAVQAVQLRRAFPESTCEISHGELVWEGTVRPTTLSDWYRVRLVYRHGKAPRVWVIKPGLRNRGGSRPEHLYGDGSLCLYYPKYREWNHSMWLARTVVPWACEWFLYYEVWLATGDWRGGGIHPGKPKDPDTVDE